MLQAVGTARRRLYRIDPHRGRRSLAAVNSNGRTLLRKTALGFIYQFHHLLPDFTARENVVLPQLIMGKTREEASDRAAELLSRLGLGQRLDHRPERSFRAASSSASPSRARSPTAQRSFWPTNRPEIWTRRPPT